MINGKCSGWAKPHAGAPGFSLVSPLPFALFMDDLPDDIQIGSLLFNDHLKFYHKIIDATDPELVQEDRDRFTAYPSALNSTLAHQYVALLESL